MGWNLKILNFGNRSTTQRLGLLILKRRLCCAATGHIIHLKLRIKISDAATDKITLDNMKATGRQLPQRTRCVLPVHQALHTILPAHHATVNHPVYQRSRVHTQETLILLAIASTSALRVPVTTRRSIVDVGFAVAVWPLAAPLASALGSVPADNEVVAGQTSKKGVLDINNSPVADYMQFPGLYPTVAGKVATHGPYKKVKDVYSAAGQHVREPSWQWHLTCQSSPVLAS